MFCKLSSQEIIIVINNYINRITFIIGKKIEEMSSSSDEDN